MEATLEVKEITRDFESAFQAFFEGAKKKVDTHYEQFDMKYTLTYKAGPKHIKLISVSISPDKSIGLISQSVYCFVERDTGLIRKPASWSSADKKTRARGSIFSPDHGLSGVNCYGVNYLYR